MKKRSKPVEKISFWSHSKKRLLVVATCIAAVAAFGANAGSVINFCTNLFSNKGLRLVELNVNANNVMDIKVRNTSADIVYIKRIELELQHKWYIRTDADNYFYQQESTANYDFLIDSNAVMPVTIGKSLSQAVSPGSTDRFQISLNSPLNYDSSVVYKFNVKLIYDENNKSITKKNLLCAFELPLQKYLHNSSANGTTLEGINGIRTESFLRLLKKFK